MKKNNANEYINTDAAVLIGSVNVGTAKQSLYRTINNQYKYTVSIGESVSETSVADISFESARKWTYEHLDKEEYSKEFSVSKSNKLISGVNINVCGEVYNIFERIRGNTGKSISEIIVDMIDYYEQTHGSLDK